MPTPKTEPWDGDLGAVEVPNPGLTLSEIVNLHAVVLRFMRASRAGGDAVLESGCEKLRESARIAGEENPRALQMVVNEVEMQQRFGLNVPAEQHG